MDDNAYIEQAIHIFHQNKRGTPLIGDIIAHKLDRFAYEVRSIDVEGGTVTGFYETDDREIVQTFPLNEVFNPGAVLKIAIDLKSQMN